MASSSPTKASLTLGFGNNYPFLDLPMFEHNKRRVQSSYMIIDHTATTDAVDMTFKDLDAQHRRRGFFGCLFHYIIRRDGVVEGGRPFDRISPLTNVLDETAITVVLVGGKDLDGEPVDNFTTEQREALHGLIHATKLTYPDIEVLGRREVRRQRTTGPALDLDPFR